MRIIAKTRKIGGSIVVTIPKDIVKANSIAEGELIEIELNKLRNFGFGALKGIGSFKKEDELTTHE